MRIGLVMLFGHTTPYWTVFKYYWISIVFRLWAASKAHNLLSLGLNHGLWTSNEAFFHWNLELLGLGRQIGHMNYGTFGVFSDKLSAPILVQCPCFPLFNHYFYKKIRIYIHIPNIYLGLGFEFRPQRTRDLAFLCL